MQYAKKPILFFIAVNDTDCPSCELTNSDTGASLSPKCIWYNGRGECKVCTRIMEEITNNDMTEYVFRVPAEYAGCTVRSMEPVCDAKCQTPNCIETSDDDFVDRTLIPSCHGCTKLGSKTFVVLTQSAVLSIKFKQQGHYMELN